MNKRDHGGNIDDAIKRFGGAPEQWIDLSTGINRSPYPVPNLSTESWTALPTRATQAALLQVARQAFASTCPMLATAGAQSAIQMLPQILRPKDVRVLSPTYNEHAATFRAAGQMVYEVGHIDALAGADVAVIVNPNNPDGQLYSRDCLLELARSVNHLIVDESFCDSYPDHSVAAHAGEDGLIVLRSFGKFYGLAGIRLGFILAAQSLIDTMQAQAGPWPVAGPAIALGTQALADKAWQQTTIARLQADCAALDAIATAAGWSLVGGSLLFRLYETEDAKAAQDLLARNHIWSRIFPYSARWIRLGLPGTTKEFERVHAALVSC